MGASDHGVSRLDLDARLDDVEAVVESTGFESFSITSVTSGVPVAIAYAARHPDRVRRLALINGYARGEDWYRVVPAMRIIRGLQDMADDDWDTYLMTMASAVMQFGDPALSSSMAAAYKSSTTARDYLAWMEESAKIDVTGLLGQVQCPTMVAFLPEMIAGALPLAREMAAGIPNAELLEGHTGPEFTASLAAFLTDRPRPAQRQTSTPSAFRTILFTDLVGHTEMMRRLGDEKGRAVLREHEALTREVLKQHGGSEVKTMGDGFLASFPSVTRAVECAVALQRAFAQHNTSAGEPLHVRVGLNAGEPIEEDGDLFGETVILAARIASSAEGGEIITSMAVRELCAGKGFAFTDRGEQVMRGFRGSRPSVRGQLADLAAQSSRVTAYSSMS
jgi:class 3 adenylate cyclase